MIKKHIKQEHRQDGYVPPKREVTAIVHPEQAVGAVLDDEGLELRAGAERREARVYRV